MINALYDSILRDMTGGAMQSINHASNTRFFETPTHRDASRILEQGLRDIVFEPETGEYWQRMANGCYERVPDILTLACDTVDKAVKDVFDSLTSEMGAKIDANMYTKAGIARKKARTKDFMLSALAFFAEAVQVSNLASLWNSSAECLPTETGILDFSSDELTIRAPRDDEYFRDPLPVKAEDVLKANIAPHFRLVLLDYFPDPHVYKTAIQCLSLAVANKGNRIFQLWHGTAGANGKNTLLDILRTILPGRVDTLTAAAITRNGDEGAKRFAAAQLDGLTFAAVDEVNGAFDTSEIKRLTGDSSIAVERKRIDAYTLKQRWALAALTNKLPSFSPATDIAFLQRLIIIPFETVFYFNEEQRVRYQQLGIEEENLKAARDKDELLAEIAEERAAALRYLIDTYIKMRKAGGRPYECERSLKLKQDYQSANDVIEQFFLEHFKHDPFGRVEYARIISLWQSFTNDKKSSTREIINKLMARFPWLEKKKSNAAYYLVGLSENETLEPDKLSLDDPKAKPSLENQENLNTDQEESAESAENSFFTLTMGKQQNPYVKLESGTFGTLGTASPESEQKPNANEPTKDTSAKEESAEDNLGCLGVLENSVFTLTMGKQQNPYVKLESASTSTLEHPNTSESEVFELDDPGRGETALPGKETCDLVSETLLSLATELYEAHRENLRKSNLPITNAHVYLDELKEYAAQKGIRGEAFHKGYLALIDSGSLAYEEPYVMISHECT